MEIEEYEKKKMEEDQPLVGEVGAGWQTSEEANS